MSYDEVSKAHARRGHREIDSASSPYFDRLVRGGGTASTTTRAAAAGKCLLKRDSITLGQDTTRASKEGSLVLTNHSRTKTSSNQSHLLRAATKRPVGSSAPSLPDRKYLMRTTRENPSEAPMAIMRDPDQLGSQRAAKPRLRPTRSSPTSRSVLPDTGRGTGLSNTLLQLKFKSVFLPCFEKCANFAHFSRARARFSFLLA